MVAPRTAPRRPPVRNPPPPPPPAQALSARPSTHLRDGLALVGLGVGGYGLAPLVGCPEWAEAVLAGGVVGSATVVAVGHRRKLRQQLHDRLVEALAPLLGVRSLDRRAVRLRAWSWGVPGLPGRIELSYAPGAPDTDPQWRANLLAAVTGRLLTTYSVTRHDRRQCQITLTRPTSPEAETVLPLPERARAERTITELIGPTAKVTGVEMTGDQLSRITVEHEAGTKLSASGYRARVERTVSTVLAGRWRARWDLESDEVVFEVRPSFASIIWLPAVDVDQTKDILATYDEVAIPYGVDEDGQELVWRPAHDPNLMVVGAPGTGKTSLEHGVLVGVSRYGWPVWVADGKGIEFLGFRDWPNVQVVATTVAEQVAVIERAWELMEHRYQLIVTGRASETDFEPLMVFLDEFADFRANCLDWYATIKQKGDPTRPPVLAKAASIARKGRSSRVHLLFATQRPDAAFFDGGDMRDNFRARISMGRLSPQGAMMMWQDPSTGTTVPRACRGRATTINDENRAVEIQTYFVSDPRKLKSGEDEKQHRLDGLRLSSSRHERLLIIPPDAEPDLDSDDGAQVPPNYRDYAAAPWVRASDRPDLDPLARQAASPDRARDLASPLALFGITGAASIRQDADVVGRPHLSLVTRPVPDPEPEDEEESLDQRFAGYGPAVDVRPDQASIGDLLLVDGDSDHWAVIDEEPGDDPGDAGYVAVCWRDDTDDAGLISIPNDERITIRHPLDEES